MASIKAQTTDLPNGVVAIDTEFVRPRNDASHLIIEGSRAAFIDTGANDGVPLLLDALENRDIDVGDVDYVFLTHVHLDHAGGAGLLMQSLPNARCVIHPRGASHMIDPAKLIAGAAVVYGEENMHRLFGDIQPIDARRIDIAENEQWFELNGRAVQAIHTEGHARHHYCLNDPQSKGVFTGDSFGISYRELDTKTGAFIFWSATPVQFDPPEAHKAIDRILDCGPEQVYLTHFSRVGDPDRLAGDLHECIDDFVMMAREQANAANRIEALESSMFEYLANRLTDQGFGGDRGAMWATLRGDVYLNARGLDVWLQRSAAAGRVPTTEN
jgi:glyoxylase-like metal-dependent hydrolase (beta-lactamase superfamily II)